MAKPAVSPPTIDPVHDQYFADPFILAHESGYYAVGTEEHPIDWATNPAGVVPMLFSTDLRHWQPRGHVVLPCLEIRKPLVWAPELAANNGRFYCYYASGGQVGDNIVIQMRVAVADTPAGPYVDTGSPLTDLRTTPFAIDGSPFRDDDGQWYFFYAVDFLDRAGGAHAGTGLVVDRMASMTQLEGRPVPVARANYPWQLYQSQRPIYARTLDWYTLEGPAVVKHGETYYCLYSGGNFQNDTYGVDYLEAPHPLGPWRCSGGQNGPRVLRTMRNAIVGPGHCALFKHNQRDYMVYHAWDPAMTARRMCIDPLEWTTQGPRIARFA